MSRGGKRSGAGRKSSLTRMEALCVGGYCETAWKEATEERTLAEYRERPATKMVAAEQARAHLIPVKLRGRSRNSLQDISESIDELVGARRATTLPLLRPYGARCRILRGAVDWCKKSFDKSISLSKASECWKEYRKWEAADQAV